MNRFTKLSKLSALFHKFGEAVFIIRLDKHDEQDRKPSPTLNPDSALPLSPVMALEYCRATGIFSGHGKRFVSLQSLWLSREDS
ncbi:MAG: hypothetical protein ACE5NG_12660 [bacterium]